MPDRGYFGVSKCIQNNNQVYMIRHNYVLRNFYLLIVITYENDCLAYLYAKISQFNGRAGMETRPYDCIPC